MGTATSPVFAGQGGNWRARGWGSSGYFLNDTANHTSLPSGVAVVTTDPQYTWAAALNITERPGAMIDPVLATGGYFCRYGGGIRDVYVNFSGDWKGTVRMYCLSVEGDNRSQNILSHFGTDLTPLSLVGTDPASWFGTGDQVPAMLPGGRWVEWTVDANSGDQLHIQIEYVSGGNSVWAGLVFDEITVNYVRMAAEPVDISLAAAAVIHSAPPQAVEAPGGLYPMYAKAFEMDEYRLMAGWPVPVPTHDIRVNSLVSASGEVIADRDIPTQIVTGALMRWIADETLWDPTALRWTPSTAGPSTVYWTAEAGHEPVLVDYEYRIADERFYAKALNFDSDTQNFLHASFNSILTGSGYTALLVMSPNSAYGNNVDVPFNGLWSPEEKAGDGYTDITMQGRYLWHETESAQRTRAISINPALASTAPFYVGIVVDRPYTTFYVADGPSSIRVQTVTSGDIGIPQNLNIFLGKSTDGLLNTADMALMDLSIYADRLTGVELRDEIALLSRAYGGDS